jgi:hypothetical protein
VNQPVETVDARTDRVAQGAVGVALLSAFVFRVVWLVPALALLLAIAALVGPQANGLHLIYERWIAPRLPRVADTNAEPAIAALTVRAQDALAAAILVVASLAFLFGIGPVGWLLTIAEAVIAILAATTGIHLAEHLRRAR